MNNTPLTYLKRVFFSLLLPAIVYIGLGLIRPDIYFQFRTFLMLLTQTMAYILIGWSMLFGMSVGLFDFSVGSRVVLSALFGIHITQYFGIPGLVLGTFASSIVLALFTALAFAVLRIPSIITGFAALLIFESVATIYQKQFKNIIYDNMKIFGTSPGIFVVAFISFLVVYIVFNHTKFGYQIKAIGGNEAVARSMGIKAMHLKLNTYIIGGVILGAATLVQIGYTGSKAAQINMSSMATCFTPMMGVMIGMFLSSCNMVIGSFIGAFCIAVVSSGLVAVGMESRLQNVVVGIFLLIFIGLKTNSATLKKVFRIEAVSN
ncbi:MAG: hypothetical protein LBE10_05060 [Treponema sp.]|jgi:ribose transport system permease protein|nr:hypothetical protein [Treponema sp.]